MRYLSFRGKTFGLFISLVAIAAMGAVLRPSTARAAACTFTGGGGTSDFHTATNWDCGHVPNWNDDATIPLGNTVTSNSNVTINNFTVNGTFQPTNASTTISMTTTIGVGGEVTNGSLSEIVFVGATQNNGSLSVGNGQITAIGNITNSGTINGGAGSLWIKGGWTNTGTFNAQQGIVWVKGQSPQSLPGLTYNNLFIGELAGGTTQVTSAGSVTVTNTLKISQLASLTSTGSLSSPNTIVDTGTLTINNSYASLGLVQVYGLFNFGLPGVLDGQIRAQGYATIYMDSFNSSGRLDHSSPQSYVYIRGSWLHTSYLNCDGSGSPGPHAEYWPGGTLVLQGSANQVIPCKNEGLDSISTFIIDKPTGSTASLNGNDLLITNEMRLQSGTFALGSYNLKLEGHWNNWGGTLNGGTGKVTLVNGGTQNLNGEPNFKNLTISKAYGWEVNVWGATTVSSNMVIDSAGAGNMYVNAPLTVQGTTNITSGNTLNISNNQTFTAVGSITNTGVMYVAPAPNPGKIVHQAEHAIFANSSWKPVSGYQSPNTIRIQVKDTNRNLNGSVIESFSVPLTGSSGSGGDMESVTLTETGVATGIFRGSIGLISLWNWWEFPIWYNNQLEITNSGSGSFFYQDAYDPTDTITKVAELIK